MKNKKKEKRKELRKYGEIIKGVTHRKDFSHPSYCTVPNTLIVFASTF
jgi:hypothetical protein